MRVDSRAEPTQPSKQPGTTANPYPAFAAAVVAATSSLLWVGVAARHGGAFSRIVLVVGFAALAAAVWCCARFGAPPLGYALALVVCTLAACVLMPLHHSRDLYLYDMYGRTAAVHHENPYDVTPEEVQDPVVNMVREVWHDHPAMYGPVFIGAASALSLIGGTDELAIRVVWQAVAAAAAIAAVAIVAHRSRSSAAVFAVGLFTPVVAAVADAHADVLVGLAVVVAVVLAERRALFWSGVVAGVAVSAKVPTALPLIGLGWWVLNTCGVRGAARWALGAVATTVLVHVPLLGSSYLQTLGDNAGDDSRFALWRWMRVARMDELIDTHSAGTVEAAATITGQEYSRWALILLIPVLGWVLYRFRRASAPELVVVSGLAWLLCTTYAMPWYTPLLLPVAALVLRSRASVLLWVFAGFLTFAYADGAGNDAQTWIGEVLELRAPYVVAAMIVILVLWVRPIPDAAADDPADEGGDEGGQCRSTEASGAEPRLAGDGYVADSSHDR